MYRVALLPDQQMLPRNVYHREASEARAITTRDHTRPFLSTWGAPKALGRPQQWLRLTRGTGTWIATRQRVSQIQNTGFTGDRRAIAV